MTRNRNKHTTRVNITEMVIIAADAAGSLDHLLIKAVQSAPQFAELNDVFKMYRIRGAQVRIVPIDPTMTGVNSYQISLVDEDDVVWTGSQGYSSNQYVYEGVIVVPACKGKSVQLPFPGNLPWKEAEDEAYVGVSETGDAEAIEFKAFGHKTYGNSESIAYLFITWDVEFKNFIFGSSH